MQYSVIQASQVGLCVLKFTAYQISGIIFIAMDIAMETSLVNFIYCNEKACVVSPIVAAVFYIGIKLCKVGGSRAVSMMSL